MLLRRLSSVLAIPIALAVSALLIPGAVASSLDEELGRSETRIYSEAFPIPAGRTVVELALPERLERLGYERVRGRRPMEPGEYFWGNEVFWIYRRAHRYDGRRRPAELVGLALRRSDGRVLGPAVPGGVGDPAAEGAAEERRGLFARAPGLPYLEPELLAESLAGDRAPRLPVPLEALPEHSWRALLAIEDARFFGHPGVDYRAVARALLANVRAGGVAQGGSTITQQLIKMRELTPKRSLGRKASEALRALALEAEVDKREILESYLDHVYYGHVEGVGVYGIGRAARVFFSKPAQRLTLAEAALLAGIIQSPNRLSPVRHPEAARQRRDRVLERMEELGWADRRPAQAARRQGLGLDLSPPPPRQAAHFLSWVAERAAAEAPRWIERGRGVVVESTLDPYLQAQAEEAVAAHLDDLRRRHRQLRGAELGVALVSLDVESGAVRAYVGGDPRRGRGGFDRARAARRQPGSTVKPLVLLEAFERCGGRPALNPASRVADEPLTLELPSGPWSPVNADNRFRGVLDLRTALEASRNVPFVRVARWCGFAPTARRLRRAGLPLPDDPPPAFVLGAVEATPLELAAAYTVFATPGEVLRPRPLTLVDRPGGRALERLRRRDKRVVRPATAYLVRELMRQAVATGTAAAGALSGIETAAKTGTSSERRDAWFAGTAGSLVTVVWVGLDDDSPLGLSGSQAAAPLWRRFMEVAVPARAPYRVERPRGIVERYVDTRTGLLVRSFNPHARLELFRRGALPPRDRFFRRDEAVPVVR